jgi:hypothetical protein
MMALLFNAIPWVLLVAGLMVSTYHAAGSVVGSYYARKEGEGWFWLFLFLSGLMALAAIAIAGMIALVRLALA